MSEFVNIEEDDTGVNTPSVANIIVEDNSNDITTIQEDNVAIKDSPTPIYHDNSNPAGSQYGDQDHLPSFKINNLFSELTDEVQRAMARYNLGIADAYAMVWGNMQGTLTDQKDLIDYISQLITSTIASNLNPKLENLYTLLYLIEDNVAFKANTDSPIFTGIPQSVNPVIGDYSKQIATTKFVIDAIKDYDGSTLKYFYITPTSITTVTDITVSWDYNNAISSQTINEVSLDTSVRNYTFSAVATSLTIILAYVMNGVTYTKSQTIEYTVPIYYGKSTNYVNDTQTISDSFSIKLNNNEYLYIFVYGSKDIYCDGILGGFINEGGTVINGLTYTLYRTTNSNLGTINISLC